MCRQDPSLALDLWRGCGRVPKASPAGATAPHTSATCLPLCLYVLFTAVCESAHPPTPTKPISFPGRFSPSSASSRCRRALDVDPAQLWEPLYARRFEACGWPLLSIAVPPRAGMDMDERCAGL